MKLNKISFILILISDLNFILNQKCQTFDINLNSLYNLNNFNNIDNLCPLNHKCDNTITSCICKESQYGPTCENTLNPVKIIKTGVTQGNINLVVLLMITIYPFLIIIGIL